MGIAVPKPKHKRRIPKQANRNEFDSLTRKRIRKRDNGECQQCGAPATQIHHVVFRSQGGRGVYENGMLVCHICHDRIHRDRKLAEYWQKVFRERYGENHFRDEWDDEWKIV